MPIVANSAALLARRLSGCNSKFRLQGKCERDYVVVGIKSKKFRDLQEDCSAGSALPNGRKSDVPLVFLLPIYQFVSCKSFARIAIVWRLFRNSRRGRSWHEEQLLR
jgi:hypothetical protein